MHEDPTRYLPKEVKQGAKQHTEIAASLAMQRMHSRATVRPWSRRRLGDPELTCPPDM